MRNTLYENPICSMLLVFFICIQKFAMLYRNGFACTYKINNNNNNKISSCSHKIANHFCLFWNYQIIVCLQTLFSILWKSRRGLFSRLSCRCSRVKFGRNGFSMYCTLYISCRWLITRIVAARITRCWYIWRCCCCR